ncbi:LysR family transcriptional regulator [Shewanella sedimentimangrovi]|uniref:LysR family transcriptional regulator n=1 Tax=Shewanella sedimentimangrovi TaxID=2814293 RepID=A0ABX7R0F0_9GAMM|nr:LysR family transcriptional regulator [Shewanella sedimentimangrovi]QSX37274.1 LysR family transcriptional regulator [Shewanella sedimentimangrovi]
MRNLNFHHLHYFWTVAKEGHLTRAAQKLNVSQSALSSQIKQLEGRLGHDLFHRQGRALSLTDVGHLVLEYAESIFNLSNELLSMMESGEQRVQQLRIGAVATLSRNFQENFLRPVIGLDKVKLALKSSNFDDLLEQLRVHKLDLILSNRPVASDSTTPWRCKLIAQQGVFLVGPNDSEFATLRFPQDLTRVKLLLPGPDSDIRTQFDLYCEQHGLSVTPYAEVDDMAMLRLLARDAGAVAVVPEVVVQDEIQAGILKNYAALDSVTESFYAITAKRHVDLPILKSLLNSDAIVPDSAARE